MEENTIDKPAEIKTENPPKANPAQKPPTFTLERLRQDCFKLFGVTASTFDGATCKLEGDFTVEKIRGIIKEWQSKPLFAKNNKGVN